MSNAKIPHESGKNLVRKNRATTPNAAFIIFCRKSSGDLVVSNFHAIGAKTDKCCGSTAAVLKLGK
jgi:hypothetical protein